MARVTLQKSQSRLHSLQRINTRRKTRGNPAGKNAGVIIPRSLYEKARNNETGFQFLDYLMQHERRPLLFLARVYVISINAVH